MLDTFANTTARTLKSTSKPPPETIPVRHTNPTICCRPVLLFFFINIIFYPRLHFFYLEKVTANHEVIAIGISGANLLGELVDGSFPVHYVPIGNL